jgi:LCP family protein required for cell wall assembly
MPESPDELDPSMPGADAPLVHVEPGTPTPPVTRRHVGLIAASFVLVVCAAFVAWAVWGYVSASRNIGPGADAPAIRAELSTSPVSVQEPEYVLVLGVDKRPGERYGRSDSIILARVDPQYYSLSLLSIPRDLRVPIAGHGTTKINAAWPYGGAALAIKTVKTVTGLPVHHYVELDLAGFTRLVDTVGGIVIDVDQPIYDRIDEPDGKPAEIVIQPGSQRLDADKALLYVRSRRFRDGDFTRMRHQQTFLSALATSLLDRSHVTRLPAVAMQLSTSMKTDMSIPSLVSLGGQLRGIRQEEIRRYTVPGTMKTIGGVAFVLPDAARDAALFDAFRRGVEPTGTTR